MNTIYLLFKEIYIGMNEFFEKHDIIFLYLIGLASSYLIAFLLISMSWFIYEFIMLGHINENGGDTITAFKWSLLLMLPIADLFIKKMNLSQIIEK